MKSVLTEVDPEAFAFLQCDVRSPDGKECPVRWLCDVIRVLDALDEEKSKIDIGVADDGSKVYRFFTYGERLTFKESIVGNSHVFWMKYRSSIICDEEFRRACKSAGVKGISFDGPLD
jgi:hypothetical protein